MAAVGAVWRARRDSRSTDCPVVWCFFFNDPATTEFYTIYDPLSLHDALPIWLGSARPDSARLGSARLGPARLC